MLLAAEEHPRALRPLIARKFAAPGDVDAALACVRASDGLPRAKALAVSQAEMAVDALGRLAPSPARDALANLAHKVVSRNY